MSEDKGERRSPRGHLLCSANGCPLMASISSGGGWLCSYHFNAHPTTWPQVTEKLMRDDVIRARTAMARLDKAIYHRERGLNQLILAVQNALVNLGADPEAVQLLEMKDFQGDPFSEMPEHFSWRMRFLLVDLVAPSDNPDKKKKKDPEPQPLDTASILSPQPEDDDDIPF